MPTRNVVVTDHQARLIERLVASGRYQNASEVLRAGLRLVEREEETHARRLASFDAAIAEGAAAIAAGELVTLESEEEVRAFVRGLAGD